MQRITPMITNEQHKWLLEQKKLTRVNTEQNVRAALDLLISKTKRAAK